MQLKKPYVCQKCNKETPQWNWSPELKKWLCNDCLWKTPATIRKDVKSWKYVLK